MNMIFATVSKEVTLQNLLNFTTSKSTPINVMFTNECKIFICILMIIRFILNVNLSGVINIFFRVGKLTNQVPNHDLFFTVFLLDFNNYQNDSFISIFQIIKGIRKIKFK